MMIGHNFDDYNDISHFVDYLAKQDTPNEMSFNMYQGETIDAIDRRTNLLYYLKTIKKNNPSILFIGEAPGNNGCLLSGIPFTDEYTLVNNAFFCDLNCRIKLMTNQNPEIKPQSETSSRVIWERLDKIADEQVPLMWNIYPFHPSTVESSNSRRPNRKPNIIECELGKDILKRLLVYFDIKQIYAIGRTPEKVLKKEFPDIIYIRHPAHGGACIFKDQFNSIYKLQ